MDLFASEEQQPIPLELPDADIVYYPRFFKQAKSDAYFQKLHDEIEWRQDDVTVFGKKYPQPRLTALYGNNDKTYTYSGLTLSPLPFTQPLKQIKEKIETTTQSSFSTVLLNLYRDGADSNGWHSDDEKELGQNPVIASVSFGTERIFHFRHKKDKSLKHKIVLEHGSLLLMKGTTQHYWQHQLPKSKRVTSPRINLTFRWLV